MIEILLLFFYKVRELIYSRMEGSMKVLFITNLIILIMCYFNHAKF
jgi:hypothetical protein